MKEKNMLILILILSLIPVFDLMTSGLPITHDFQDHVARIGNFYQNLMEGNIIPRWAGNLNWGYGHPILMFLYPLPSYIASSFHFLGFSLVDSTKLVFGLAFIASALAMYFWVNQFLGKWPAFASALLYIYAPYRFVDLYVRGAIGEHVAFVFPPLIFYFLLKLSKRYSYWYLVGGSLSLAGLLLSHNAVSLMFLPIIFVYALFLLYQSKDKKLNAIRYTLITLFGFGLSAFFWLPAFFEGKYTLRDIVTAGEYASRLVNFQSLLWGEWNYGISGQFSVQVGIIQWLVVILSLPTTLVLFKKKKKEAVLLLGTLIIFLLTLFIMLSHSKTVWEIVTILQKFQFPWRFLSVTVFTTAVLGGIALWSLPKNKQFTTCVLLTIALLFFNKDYWYAKDYKVLSESFFTSVYHSTTDTGESSPIWSVRFMEQEPKAHIETISGTASVQELQRTSTFHEYKIEAETSTRIRENTLYFPGWKVFVDGKEVSVEFQDPLNRGLITFNIPEGKHIVELKFVETKLRFLSNIISVVSFSIILFLGILRRNLLVWQR